MKKLLIKVTNLPRTSYSVDGVRVDIDREADITCFKVILTQGNNYYKTYVDLNKTSLKGDIEVSDWIHELIGHFINLNNTQK